MSQRTSNGAYVDAMLKAYRRTLQKTLEQARSMEQVVADPTVKLLADTPDKAVVWGFALGLHAGSPRCCSAAWKRGTDPQRATTAYYPLWFGSPPSTLAGARAAGWRPGSIFSGSGMPDIGGMFSAIGSIGSSPPVVVLGRGRIRRRRWLAAAAAGAAASEAPAGADACQRVSWERCHTNDDLTDAPAAADPAAPGDPATAHPSATARRVTDPPSGRRAIAAEFYGTAARGPLQRPSVATIPSRAASRPRPMDDGGMSIRLDPRRLGALKLLAAEAGVRPGELRDPLGRGAARRRPHLERRPSAIAPDGLAALAARVDELARRLDRMARGAGRRADPGAGRRARSAKPRPKRGRGRPRKVAGDAAPVPAKARAKRATTRKASPRPGRARPPRWRSTTRSRR